MSRCMAENPDPGYAITYCVREAGHDVPHRDHRGRQWPVEEGVTSGSPENAAIKALEAAGHEVTAIKWEDGSGSYACVDGYEAESHSLWNALIAAAQKAAGSGEDMSLAARMEAVRELVNMDIPDLEGVLHKLDGCVEYLVAAKKEGGAPYIENARLLAVSAQESLSEIRTLLLVSPQPWEGVLEEIDNAIIALIAGDSAASWCVHRHQSLMDDGERKEAEKTSRVCRSALDALRKVRAHLRRREEWLK